MKLKTPTITVHNTDGPDWLISADGLVSAEDGLETINFSVMVPRSDRPLPEVTRQAARRAILLLQMYVDHPMA